MAFTTQMVNLLKSSGSFRREMLAFKLAQNAEKRAAGVIRGVKPTKEAKQVVSFLEKEEKRVLNSKEARQAFDQVVKPEANYRAVEDCFDKGYYKKASFKNDSDNLLMFDLMRRTREIGTDGFILREQVHADSVSETIRRLFIDPMKKIRAQQGEVDSVISQKGLRIDLPLPKPPKSASSAMIIDPITGRKVLPT